MPAVEPTRPDPRAPRHRVAAGALACLLALGATPGLAGCSGSGQRAPSDVAASPAVSYLRDPAAVESVLRERFDGSPTMRRLTIWSDMLAVEVRDPAKPENLDTYTFRAGQWTQSPVRVTMSEIEELDARVFTLADLDLTVVPGLIGMALEGLDLEGETVTAVSYDRVSDEGPRVYVGVDGLRGSGSLIANADGSQPTIRRN
jgi:hypothetical protein